MINKWRHGMTNRIYFQKYDSEEDFKYYFSLVSSEEVMAMVTEMAIFRRSTTKF